MKNPRLKPRKTKWVEGWLVTRWDCENCGNVNDTEGDASYENVACDQCGEMYYISNT